MPLGRFAAYFFLLMIVCLVAFPRAVGAPPSPGAVKLDLPAGCTLDTDGSPVCVVPHPPRRRAARTSAPAPRRLLEAGGPVRPLFEALSAEGLPRRPLDS